VCVVQALTAVLNSSQGAEPQNKTYLAGFIARAVAKVGKGKGEGSQCNVTLDIATVAMETFMIMYWMHVMQDLLTLKMVCPLFDQGAHHPTVLVLLQALTALLGEVRLLILATPYRLCEILVASSGSISFVDLCQI